MECESVIVYISTLVEKVYKGTSKKQQPTMVKDWPTIQIRYDWPPYFILFLFYLCYRGLCCES